MDNGVSSYHRFLSGDKSGLEEIIRFYSDSLTLYLCTLVGNIDDAREIMTETFVKLYVKKPKYSGKSTFKTWLYSIARHTAYDFLKNKSKYQSISDEELNSLPSRYDLEKELESEDEKKALYKAIDKLKPEYRQVIYLIGTDEASIPHNRYPVSDSGILLQPVGYVDNAYAFLFQLTYFLKKGIHFPFRQGCRWLIKNHNAGTR